MPSINSKRTLEEIAAAEDSNDDDYDDRAPSSSRPKSRRTQGAEKHVRKKQRRTYKGSDVTDDGSDDADSDDDSFGGDDKEDIEVETNDNGRPVRRTARKAITYVESDSDEDDDLKTSSSEEETKKQPKKIIKLKVATPGATPAPQRRTPHARSASYGTKHPPTSSSSLQPTRKSSRLSHDEDEPVLALTNSGRHVEVVREGSRDPEGIPPRAFKGGKGIKYPSKSTIDEEDEDSGPKGLVEEPVELEIMSSQHEGLENEPQGIEDDPDLPRLTSDIYDAANELELEAVDLVQDSDVEPAEDDDDEGPTRRGRTRQSAKDEDVPIPAEPQQIGRLLRPRAPDSKRTSRTRKKAPDESSDFEPQNEREHEDELSSSSASEASPRKQSQRNEEYESSNGGRRSARLRKRISRVPSSEGEEDELAAEVADLKRETKKKRPRAEIEEITMEPRGKRRQGQRVDYNLMRGATFYEEDDDAGPSPSQQRSRGRGGAGASQRGLFNLYGPFGGGSAIAPVFGGHTGLGAEGDVDSDSSDDDIMKRPKAIGGMVGMTPTTAYPSGINPFFPPAGADPAQAAAGTPANLGKIKDKQALADADPLGVDQNINFDSVGGLKGHIDQLKEMVSLPLLYPEIFQRFHITPPRGVLFYGPPGTGKTLLARALASSVSSQGRKVTFYMRKGADALSKWVGEAERQLRLLFEEARKTQPSIIFFDEIDGLAPVRSAKQDQIHASIVSTLLALMDGMDGRGQVIIIGATNRPDSIDPALRRPGRFDREFYFPLPDTDARRSILDIHTKGWNPPLEPAIKDQLAKLTKGYGGADLRALCTEAALNAVQRRYPQIYISNEKLIIDPKTIEVTPKDFMISVKKMIPSSERSASSGASPLPESIAPLLRQPLAEIQARIKELLPQKKKTTALEEAQFEDVADGHSFGREIMQQNFEMSRVYRPRFLIEGRQGMGQNYLAAAVLNQFEGMHVQAFDLPTLHGDSASSPEATMIRLFADAKLRMPSVIYLPNVQDWYHNVGPGVVSTFLGLLRSLKPTDPVLVLGILDADKESVDEQMRRDLFGYSKKSQYELRNPANDNRNEFFTPMLEYVSMSPDQFPDPKTRTRRKLEILRVAPAEPEKPVAALSAEEVKLQKKRDRQTLNILKQRIQSVMDQIRNKHRKFRNGVIDESQIRYLFEEADPDTVTSDVPVEIRTRAAFRPYELGKDKHGETGLIEQVSGKFYYNMNSVIIEKRLSNGYYKRPRDFLADIKKLAKDAKTLGDEERMLKANELQTNVEVDMGSIELDTALMAECEKVYEREVQREKEAIEKARKAAEQDASMPPPQVMSNVPHGGASQPSTENASTGAVILGEPFHLSRPMPMTPSRPSSKSSALTNGVSHVAVHEESGGSHDADIEDTPMEGMDSNPHSHERSNETQRTHSTSSFGQSAQPRPPYSYTAPSQQLLKESGMSAPLSQTGVLTPMPKGSEPGDFQNEASTTQTTSGKKNSSGEREQARNGELPGPDFFTWQADQGSQESSQLPSTLGKLFVTTLPPHVHRKSTNIFLLDTHTQSQPISAPASSQPAAFLPASTAPPAFPGSRPQSSHSNIPASQPQHQSQPLQPLPAIPPFEVPPPAPQRNPSDPDLPYPTPTTTAPVLPKPNLLSPDPRLLSIFHAELRDRTSGLSVEQLEQVNSVLMDHIWQSRGEYDRGAVLEGVTKAFGEVIRDMEEAGQEFAESSWGAKGAEMARRRAVERAGVPL